MPSPTEPRVHGGATPAELAALGIDPAELIDFSVSTNPYALAALRADALYLANPATPSGRAVAHEAVARLATRLTRTTLVLDESFLSLSERADDATRPLPANVVRVRSLTKDHALPGLRIGYLVAAREIATT